MDVHETGGLWLLREMWGFPMGVPEDERLEYLKTILACAGAKAELADAEREWVIGYGAACGAHQATIDALTSYAADEDVDDILNRNMPAAEAWGRVAIFDGIRAAGADGAYDDEERRAIRHVGARIGVPDDVIAEIEALHAEEQALRQRRIALIFGDQPPYQDRA